MHCPSPPPPFPVPIPLHAPQAFVAPLPLRALRGVGFKADRTLRESLGVETAADARRLQRAQLVSTLGEKLGALRQHKHDEMGVRVWGRGLGVCPCLTWALSI